MKDNEVQGKLLTNKQVDQIMDWMFEFAEGGVDSTAVLSNLHFSLVVEDEPVIKQCPFCCVYYEEPVPSIKLLELRDLSRQAEIGREQAKAEIAKRSVEKYLGIRVMMPWHKNLYSLGEYVNWLEQE